MTKLGVKRYEVRSWVCDYGIYDLKKDKFIGKPIESLAFATEVFHRVFEGLTY